MGSTSPTLRRRTLPNTEETYTYKSTSGGDLLLDVHRDESAVPPTPAILFLHGGAFREGSRKECGHGYIYTRRGYAVISIDYRLLPDVTLPSIIDDVRDALHWVRDRGPELAGIDPHRIGAVGRSAGGYLALMAGMFSSPPNVLASYYGFGNITRFHHESWFKLGGYHPAWSAEGASGGRPKKLADDGLLDRYSPAQLIKEGYPPTVLLHGTADTMIPCDESVQMADSLARAGVEHRLITVPDAGHGFDGFIGPGELSFKKQAIEDKLDFLDAHLCQSPGSM